MVGVVGFDIEIVSVDLIFKGGYEGLFVWFVGWVVDDGELQIFMDL